MRLFDWWKAQGKTLYDLANLLGYSYDYTRHVSTGQVPLTESFKMRCELRIGPFVTQYFGEEAK